MFTFFDVTVLLSFLAVIVFLITRLMICRKKIDFQKDLIRFFEQTLDHSPDIIWLKDRELRIIYVNSAYRKLFPHIKDFTGLTDEELSDRFLADGYRRDDEFVIKSGKDYRYQENDKGTLWFETVKFPLFSLAGPVTGCGGIARNITDRKNEELMNYEMEHVDFLTGVSNRQSLMSSYPEKLALAVSKHIETALFEINLANFRLFNVTHGYQNGDMVLRTISFRLRSFCQEYKSCLSRTGGDSFGVIIEDVANPEEIADKLNNLVKIPINLGSETVEVSASISMVTAPGDTSNFEDMCKKSEVCIQYNRINGLHQITPYSSIHKDFVFSEPLLESDLCEAIDQKMLTLVYQPKINADTHAHIGSEALLRWNSRRFGDVSPRKFIPLAEASGSIYRLGYWVIEKCIKQNIDWSNCGYEMKPISINLTQKQFLDQNLIDVVRELLNKYNYAPELLEFETSEIVFNAYPEESARIASELHEMGIKICLDDFGNSFSNMVSVTSNSVDSIKLDDRFVRDIDSDVAKKEIVRTIYELCKRYGLQVIAEGVETKNELARISGIGINSIQGFYYTKPMIPRDFEQFICSVK